MASPSPTKRAETLLREFALAYPEAREEFPWGERVVKVRKKIFIDESYRAVAPKKLVAALPK